MCYNILRGHVRLSNLAPWTIRFYHKPIWRNGSDREEIFFRLQRTKTRGELSTIFCIVLFICIVFYNSIRIVQRSYHPLIPIYKPNCNMEFASSGLPSKECTTPAVNLSLCFRKIRTKSSLALRQWRNIGNFRVEHKDNCISKYFFWMSLGQNCSLS